MKKFVKGGRVSSAGYLLSGAWLCVFALRISCECSAVFTMECEKCILYGVTGALKCDSWMKDVVKLVIITSTEGPGWGV